MNNNWPRVTEILRDFGFYDAYDKPFIDGKSAMARGTYVDMGCNLLAEGKELDPDWVLRHLECQPYISAFRRFMQEHKWAMWKCQQEVRHETERYIGHYDQLGVMDNFCDVLLSLKTGDIPSWCALQEAFYVNAMGNRPKRMALQLKNDGTYTLREFKDPRDLSEASILARAWWIRAKYLGRGE